MVVLAVGASVEGIYASKEKVYSDLAAFVLPKGSPLKASAEVVCFYAYFSIGHYLIFLQTDFNEAVAWWVATGINLKMLAEYEAQYGSISNFWTRPKNLGPRPLTMSQVLLAFILPAVTITVSLIVFVIELCLGRNKQGVRRQREKRRQETLLQGQRREDMTGGREERGIVLRGVGEDFEAVSRGTGYVDREGKRPENGMGNWRTL